MKSCPPCNGDCQQSDTCPARKPLPITMEDEPPFGFDWSMRLLRDFCAAAGLIAMVGLIAFFFGYKS